MRTRLRPAHSQADLEEIYQKPHDARGPAIYGDDHEIRVEATKLLIDDIGPIESAADLSCGNAELLDYCKADRKFYGDFAPGYQFKGPIEVTINSIPDVDLFLCCETLEHLDDPDKVLRWIGLKARNLIISTPDDEVKNSDNIQHYWSWTQDDVEEMLV